MINSDFFERKIGFNDIRTRLKGRCFSTLGTEWVDTNFKFLATFAEVRRALDLHTEFVRLFQEDAADFDADFFDVREPLLRVRPERTYMEEQDLFYLKRSLATIERFATLFCKTADEKGEDEAAAPLYPTLASVAADVAVFPDIVKRIDEVLNKYGKVKDTASPELLSIRHQIEINTRGISHALRGIINEARTEGYINRDISPTLRDGRLVIPVAPALKKKIKGIVHDESATGKTVFIEPTAVVEANNKIRELKAAERREIIRILQELTAAVRPALDDILASLRFLALIDFQRALMTYAESMDACVPRLSSDPCLTMREAYHPLLVESLKRKGEEMTPLNVSLPRDKRFIIISGPNAGGKSVCLKTVGLLQYMLQCGMPVPVSEASTFGIFSQIFIDMGDEQSIENDLSTYSSHLQNMKLMLRETNATTLLLIDEMGSGTEPQIGGILAECILDRFVQSRAFGVITTHYQNLKQYASHTPGVVAGAMLYDRQQLQPLFTLALGTPGSSFALEIARKIGLPADLIREAEELVGRDYVVSEKYIQDIIRDKNYWENKRRAVHDQEKNLDRLLERYDQEITDTRTRRQAVLAEAREQAQTLLESANARIENTIREIREAEAERERTKQVRRDLQEFKEEALSEAADLEEQRLQRKMRQIEERRKRREERRAGKAGAAGNAATAAAAPQKAEKPVVAGCWVRLKEMPDVRPGRVETVKGRSAKVLFGSIYNQIDIARLEVCDAPAPEKPLAQQAVSYISRQTRDAIDEKKLNFKPDIDLRGMRVDEALYIITNFIDDAVLLGVSRVRILHGTGTGALRELTRNYLRTVPQVKHVRDEHVQFGGAGITVVDLE